MARCDCIFGAAKESIVNTNREIIVIEELPKNYFRKECICGENQKLEHIAAQSK